MKIIGLIGILGILGLAGWMQEAGDVIQDARGTIKKIGSLGYAIEPDDQPGYRYAPTNMSEDFKKDGLRVLYSGTVGDVPNSGRGGRVWGTPLELSSIKLLEE